jgi:uncharacterized membrane protein YvbJ
MVYCVKCGTKNDDNTQVCTQCGARLYVTGESEHYRRMEGECFGIPRGGSVVGVAIGLIIMLAGIIWFLQQTGAISTSVGIWPFAIIIFGALMIIGALFALRRRY